MSDHRRRLARRWYTLLDEAPSGMSAQTIALDLACEAFEEGRRAIVENELALARDERDRLRADLAAVTRERDDIAAALATAEEQLADLRARAVRADRGLARASLPDTTHTAETADSRATLCGLPREPAFLAVPASAGVTCVTCLRALAAIFEAAASRNLEDAIQRRERAERAEADLARVTAECDEWRALDARRAARVQEEQRLTDEYRAERDAARAQVRALLKVARAAAHWDYTPTIEECDALHEAVKAIDPSMLEEPSDG